MDCPNTPSRIANLKWSQVRDQPSDFFTDWATRVKQIAKLWRKASSQERAPYVVRCSFIKPHKS